MKPNNRKPPIKGCRWKKDFHLHDKKHHKIDNWWVELSENQIGRNIIKQKIKKDTEKI